MTRDFQRITAIFIHRPFPCLKCESDDEDFISSVGFLIAVQSPSLDCPKQIPIDCCSFGNRKGKPQINFRIRKRIGFASAPSSHPHSVSNDLSRMETQHRRLILRLGSFNYCYFPTDPFRNRFRRENPTDKV
ncbi:hypothetical protein CEXT_384661 [Caerostris extrusa]|uniref:Uncharacterized protein n=1 Tax=Caerostris extrusa TaxID=172846 RepID=A0AAV4RWL4_CAEEX|nr:hypothetical protein CEXT_384661 [Caerostris extrusa]